MWRRGTEGWMGRVSESDSCGSGRDGDRSAGQVLVNLPPFSWSVIGFAWAAADFAGGLGWPTARPHCAVANDSGQRRQPTCQHSYEVS